MAKSKSVDEKASSSPKVKTTEHTLIADHFQHKAGDKVKLGPKGAEQLKRQNKIK